MRKLRILFVVNTPWFFAMHRLPLALAAAEEGFDVHVVSGSERGAEELTNAGLVFHRIPLSRHWLSPGSDLRMLFALHRLYRELRPDLVHHITWKPIVYGSIAAKSAGVRAVVNAFAGLGSAFVGDSVAHRLQRTVILGLLRAAGKNVNAWAIFENRDDSESLIAARVVKAETTIVTPGIGVDVRMFPFMEERNEQVVRVLFASRMLREKGVEDLVEAARILRARRVPVHVVLAGDVDRGNPSAISREELEDWNKEGVVEWIGFQSNVVDLIREANIVCLPTYYREGIPRILMEAAAIGRAIITTDSPGCRDIVMDGVNGLLVAKRDVAGLADAIERLAGDASMRRRFGQAGRRLVEERFTVEQVIQRTMDLYRQALRIHRQGGAARMKEANPDL